MEFSGAEIIVKMLEQRGIDCLAGMPGGANLHIYKALYHSSIRHVLVRHEQAAGFIAQGMARSTGKAAVCLVTSGPGATNLLTAIADAKLDSVPVVAIAGQVAADLIGTDAFQEIDTYGLTIPITKHNFLVRSARDLLHLIPEAFYIAEQGRPGPVLIDVPKNVQQELVEFDEWPTFKSPHVSSAGEAVDWTAVLKELRQAKRPVIVAGAGIVEGGAEADLLRLSEQGGIPVCCTLRALGAFPADHPLYLGMLGMHGTPYANLLLNEADLLVVLGARLDDRATGKIVNFCPQARLLHVDLDGAELNKVKQAVVAVQAEVGGFLNELLERLENYSDLEPIAAWQTRIRAAKAERPYLSEPAVEDVFHPLRIIDEVAAVASEDALVVTDVGQHQMWVAMRYPFRRSRSLLTSAGLGTMGFGLPAALGAALAFPKRQVLCFTGDGSFLMNIQELATVADEQPDLKILLYDNRALGLVRQQQELFYGAEFIGSRYETQTDFVKVAEGFGIRAVDLACSAEPLSDLRDVLHVKGPVLIRIPVLEEEKVLPMVPPGAANHQMIG